MTQVHTAKFALGQIVRHRDEAFCGLVVDVDAVYAGDDAEPTSEHPSVLQRDQPFYRVLAMGEDAGFMVYAAEGVLEPDSEAPRLSRDEEAQWFTIDSQGRHAPRAQPIH